MPNERIVAIAYLMAKNNLTAGLYKMKRLKNCGLSPQSIGWQDHKNHLDEFENSLAVKFPEQDKAKNKQCPIRGIPHIYNFILQKSRTNPA